MDHQMAFSEKTRSISVLEGFFIHLMPKHLESFPSKHEKIPSKYF